MKMVILSLVLLITTASYAQQDPLFTQYIYNKLEFNPAYAGSGGAFAADLITRFQWVGIQDAPRTITLTAHTPLRNPHIGLGLYAYNDVLGPSVNYGVLASFAYRIIFPATKLCFGIQAGFKYMDIDWGALNPKDAGDIELSSQVRNRAVPDVDFGIYYYGKRFYVGLSAKHLLENQIVVSQASVDDLTGFTKLRRNYYLLAGGAISLSDDLVFMPSMLCKYMHNTPFQFDLNGSFLIWKMLTLGASYRTNSALGLIAGVSFSGGFSFGYSYDIWFNGLYGYNQGSHEIRISYEINFFDKSRMLTPRYF